MPAPCTNCVRFHYGPCRADPKRCYHCNGWGHIERYCPRRKGRVIRQIEGEPLPGTRAWCDFLGLNDDPELKSRVLQTLKTDPGSAINVNGVCIYGGNAKSFSSYDRFEEPRGRIMEERTANRRLRSLSPGDDKSRPDSWARRSGAPSPPRGYLRRYRSRSPIRQRPGTTPFNQHQGRPRNLSPYRHPHYRARSPKYDVGSAAVIFDARDREPENRCR
jgi:hypothetical protein